MKLLTVWDDRYCTTAASTNSTTKQAAIMQAALAEGLLDVQEMKASALDGAWADVDRVHDPAYAEAVRTGKPRQLAESQGFTWSPAFADALARIWVGEYAAAMLALVESRFVFHPVSGAHHAGYRRGSGFCTLNFLAGAALRLIREDAIDSVGIIDLDAHQGNGTFDWVKADSRIAAFDVSGGSWGVDRTPWWAPYFVVKDDAEYEAVLVGRLDQWLDAVTPEVVLYQAGMDCWDRDPVGGIRGVDRSFLAWRDRYVLKALHERKIPTVINLGGGYAAESVALHVQTARIACVVEEEADDKSRAAGNSEAAGRAASC